jgi:hypothetical protein
MGGGEQRRHRPSLERAEHGGPLGARRLHHGQHVVHELLERGGADHRVGEAGAAPVEHDEAREAAHALERRG